jgi:molybdate transport system permease protein
MAVYRLPHTTAPLREGPSPLGCPARLVHPRLHRRLHQRIRLPLRMPAVGLALWLCLAAVLAFLTLPVAAVFVDSTPGRLIESLGERAALEALSLSLQTSTIAIAVVMALGTPAAYLLASRSFPGKAALVTLIELPLVLPPAVAGVGLLAALGPHGLLGSQLADLHVRLVLAKAGVVVALAFVAFPFYVRQAQEALAAVDRRYLDAARTLGAGPAESVVRIAIPIALPGLAAGLALAWGRAMGEFGATLMFAGAVQGVTQTVPLAIYGRFATDFPGSLALSALLIAVSLALLLTVKALFRPRAR